MTKLEAVKKTLEEMHASSKKQYARELTHGQMVDHGRLHYFKGYIKALEAAIITIEDQL